MNKIWSYISAFLGGALLMLIIAWKFMAGDDYTVEVKKIKNKNVSGSVDVVIDSTQDSPEIPPENKRESRKIKREKRKAKRKNKNGNSE